MFTQELYAAILRFVSERGAATVTVLVEDLHTSESTIRRDLGARLPHRTYSIKCTAALPR